MHFRDLQLHPLILSAVSSKGYDTPTPIQRESIPAILAGKDLVAIAQTGTGKTAAFALPILHRLHAAGPRARAVRVLVLSPTRELASQIGDGFEAYGRGTGRTHTVIFGGVGHTPQVQAVRRGVDVLVATPGRLLDLMSQRVVDFSQLEVLVLDEADRMLDMGFIHDVKKIIAALPKDRQTLLFSATMPADIEELARRILKDPERVVVTPPATTVERIAQSVYFVEQKQKRELLLHLLKDPSVTRAIVFTRTKRGADRVAKTLSPVVGAAAIHGNKSQGARERALEGFKCGSLRVLVATDIAARGIDVEQVSHVIQLDLPEVPEQYVHRIGRTARAGTSGVAWAFCASDERPLLKDIERTIRLSIDVVREHPYVSSGVPDPALDERPRGRAQRPGQRPSQPRPSQPRRASGGGGGGRGRARSGSSSSPRPVASAAGTSTSPTSPARTATRSFRPGRR